MPPGGVFIQQVFIEHLLCALTGHVRPQMRWCRAASCPAGRATSGHQGAPLLAEGPKAGRGARLAVMLFI